MSDLVSQNLNMIFKTPKGETVHALKDLNFTLKKGELLTVLGPSGCGKTTLLNITAGFIRPTSGNITLNNKEIDGPGVERGMVFQQGALFEWLTVAENVNFGLRMKNNDPIETQKKVDEWLEIVGLKGFGNTPTYQLSGGMQQRVALARCLINDPDLILMDEPLGALDALTREKMQSLVLKIWKETGKTIILITHSVEEALLLGERLYVMAPRPGRGAITYNLSPSNKASSTECVIRIIVFPVSFQIFKTKDCIFSLVRASRAPKGSSIKIKSGSLIRHLARATLCCIPPDN